MNQMMAPWSPGQPARPDSGSGQCGIMVDECCGMAQDGCCQGGQQCYTYYETVCENVTKKRCNPKFKQICVEETLPDCKIQKERRTAVSFVFNLIKKGYKNCHSRIFLNKTANLVQKDNALTGRDRCVT